MESQAESSVALPGVLLRKPNFACFELLLQQEL
jgi:hypothetical protein